MKIIMLGTGDAFSSGGRANTSIFLDGTYKILLDCSPHAVYSLRKCGYSPNQMQYVFITHLHGDHVGGLPFLLLNLIHKEKGKIIVSGPPGLSDLVNSVYSELFGQTNFTDYLDIRHLNKNFPFQIDYMQGSHSILDFIYKIEMDGIKIVYTGDTRKVDLSEFAFQADYLFHEAAEFDEKNAEKSGHTTPLQAAKIANEAQVKNLVLIHRPEFDTGLINKIKNIFPNTIFPNDFDIIEQQSKK
mgnify:FL=1